MAKHAAESAVYVYGVVPGDVEVDSDFNGIGGGEVEVVRSGELAALVTGIPADQPIGQPEDLHAHARVLDTVAAAAPVLPLRFGAVMTDEDSVAEELLDEHQDEFRDALRQLEGQAEYVIKARYDHETILKEVLAENPNALKLRDQIKATSEEAGREARIALGEYVSAAITAKRDEDTNAVVEKLSEFTDMVAVREPTHEEDALHLACLFETDKQDQLEELVSDLEKQWKGRVEVRLLGPLAPYDFVVSQEPAGDQG